MRARTIVISLALGAGVVCAVACYADQNKADAEAHLKKGLPLMMQGSPAAAIGECQQATMLDPTSRDGWFALGSAFIQTRQWEESVKAFERVVVLKPDDGQGHYFLAQALIASGKRLPEARDHYDRSQQLGYQGDPSVGEALQAMRARDVEVEHVPFGSTQ
ncbi:MAG: tetratricopeptide repeat protein [Candidatus Omnitrophica bacterium]|nr:tetratricopeptide repeat protein [Candidatus Omnitrophota bacterium]